MFDAETAALLRAVHEEVCVNLPQYETRTRTHVASKILEAASNGERRIADLKKTGTDALKYAIHRTAAGGLLD